MYVTWCWHEIILTQYMPNLTKEQALHENGIGITVISRLAYFEYKYITFSVTLNGNLSGA